MKLLESRVRAEGHALDERVLLVDSFLNHQVDPELMLEIGKEFARLFANEAIMRVMTVESSGIAPATMTALVMRLPLVIMKKYPQRRNQEGLLETEVYSFTKNQPYILTVKREFIHTGDRVLLIDDFLANGEAAFGAIRLIEAAGATACGVGAVVCKSFQPGKGKLLEKGYRVEALADVAFMQKNTIRFVGETL